MTLEPRPIAALMLAASDVGSTGALVTFLIYTGSVLVLCWFAHRMLTRKAFLSEYYLGSRGLGPVALTLTLGATAASAGSFAGFPSLVYTHGWVLALWIASYMVVPLCVLGLLGKRLNQVARKTGAITLPDVFRDRFESPALALAATLLMVLMLAFYLIPQFKLAALILQELLEGTWLLRSSGRAIADLTSTLGIFTATDATYLACLFMFGVLVVFYTTVGGFRADVWTDTVQGLVMVGGVMFLLVLVLWQVGGLGSATRQLSRMIPPRIGQAVFERTTNADATVLIPLGTWFQVSADEGASLLLRTNENAALRAGETASRPVKIVQIVTPEEIDRVMSRWPDGQPPPLPQGVVPSIVQLEDYEFGAGTRGAYVSAPGPHPTSPLGFLPVTLAISFFVYYALSTTGQPGNMVRLMAFDSSRTLKRAIVLLTVYFGLIYFPLVIIFCCARIVLPGLDQSSDRIMPALTVQLAGDAGIPWLAGILIAAPFAAAMSTVDSFMLMVSSAFVRDVYQRNIRPQASEREVKWLSYACMFLLGATVTLAAANPPNFMQYLIVFAGGGLSVVFFIPLGLALYWPRMNRQGMLASMFVGLGAYLSLYGVGFLIYGQDRAYMLLGLDPIIWGYLAGLLAGILGSLATNPPPAELTRRFFG